MDKKINIIINKEKEFIMYQQNVRNNQQKYIKKLWNIQQIIILLNLENKINKYKMNLKINKKICLFHQNLLNVKFQ